MKKSLIYGCCTLLLTASAARAQKPDFRYPEDVAKEATADIASAQKKSDGQKLIDGLIRLSLAKTKVSADYMPQLIDEVHDAATSATDPATKSILLSLEAEMYAAYYQHYRDKFDNRTTTNGSAPTDIAEWTKQNFIDKVNDLTTAALANRDKLAAVPAKDYSRVLTLPKTDNVFAPTLYDVVAYRAIDQLNRISIVRPIPLARFYTTAEFSARSFNPSEKTESHIDSIFKSLLDIHKNDIPAYIYAEIYRLRNTADRVDNNYRAAQQRERDCLLALYDRFADSPYSSEPLIELTGADDPTKAEEEKLYKLAKNNISRFPDYNRIGALKNFVNDYEQQTVTLSYDAQALPGDSISMKFILENLGKVVVRAYRIPESLELRNNLTSQLDKMTPAGEQTFDFSNVERNAEKQRKFAGLPVGRYIFVPEITDNRTGQTVKCDRIYSTDVLRVSNLDVTTAVVAGERRVYVTNSTDGRPVSGATVHISTNGGEEKELKTNKQGYVVYKESRYADGYATYGNDRSIESGIGYYGNNGSYSREQTFEASIMTDLAVYRPGETVRFAAVVSKNDATGQAVCKGKTVTVELFNSTSEKVDSLILTTDDFGRVDSTFVIPQAGLTGNYTISVLDQDRFIGSRPIQISEYKAPTFYVELDRKASSLTSPKSLRLEGKAMSYSQFPIANAKVTYKLSPYTFFFETTSNNEYSGETTTDAQGKWSADIPESIFGEGKDYGRFRLTVTATSENGESQSLSDYICIGDRKYIDGLNNITVEATAATRIPFTVRNITGSVENTVCRYALVTEKNDTIASGTANPQNSVFDFSKISSGKYKFSLSIDGDKDGNRTVDLVLYRPKDSMPPYSTSLWVPEEKVQCSPSGKFSVRYGNSKAGYIYYALYNTKEVVKEGWIRAKAGMHTYEGRIDCPSGSDAKLMLASTLNHKTIRQEIVLKPATAPDSLKIVTESFRDNITPGSRETWTIRLTGNNVKAYKGAVIANMYDAALNAIATNTYSPFAIDSYATYPFQFNPAVFMWQRTVGAYTDRKQVTVPMLQIPELNMYGQQFFAYRAFARGGRLLHSMTLNSFEADADAVVTEKLAAPAPATGQTGSTQAEAFAYRDPKVKTAFFMPSLVSNENGEVTIRFEVPNRNTQWQFTALAYTDSLLSDTINRVITSNKTLMVQPNLPRFVRIGDKATVKASVMNNSSAAATANVLIEIFNPENGETVTTDTQVVNLPANGSQTVTTDIPVGDSYAFLGYRIKATAGNAADGEQSLIAVLPSTTDVVEADPFYMTDKQQTAKINLPKFPKGGKVTFEYVDNPAWYCAIALPSILSDCATATAFASNYYTTVVADRLVNGTPHFAEAIRYWSKNNSLKSNLQKNADLKTVELGNTPWSQVAESETESMSRLNDLTDPATIQFRKQKALTSLAELQNPDGGFAWFKGDRSSSYTTHRVLATLGQLRELGYNEKDALADSIAARAIRYCDNNIIKELSKEDKPERYYWVYTYYFGIRSSFADIQLPQALEPVKTAILDYAAKKWGKASISGKADAAVLLANYGRNKEAEAIAKSLRQYARKTDGGMYWDVENADKVALASTVLRVFHKLNPNDADIDRIRQWLLLQKETQNWGSSIAACDAVNAVLATGKSWTNVDRKAPSITIGGKAVNTEDADRYFGYIKQSIDLNDASGNTLEIRRHGNNPAWGAVFCSYNAPMNEVARHSARDIKVEKRFYVYNPDGKVSEKPVSALNVGDRIQVRITVKTERDLDFVALTDDRAACLEPVDQLPRYDYADRAFFYRETRDSATTFFISSLNKGTYVFTYDAYVNNAGTFSSGIATAQCQYAPQIVSHSAGTLITAK